MAQAATREASGTEETARRYFDAVAARDVEAMVGCWKPGGLDRLVGFADLPAPDGVREYFDQLFSAFPDAAFEVLDVTAEDDRCAVRWRMRGTFAGPGSFQGFEPNGARVDLEGCDVVRVADGLVVHNDAYVDGATLARQIGALPPANSTTERRMTAAMNLRTRLARRLGGSAPERVADGVWLVRGGFPAKTMNVYLIEENGQITVFDAGIEAMTKSLALAGAELGGIGRVVLGHGHADHRGAAPGLDVPVFCHPAEVDDAQGDGGEHYFDFSKLRFHARLLMPRMLKAWDGGPVRIEGTVSEGDRVGEFEVIHLPGHAPGLIGLWRERDRLALTSDCFYTLDPQTGRKGHPRVPHRAFNHDHELARASIRKLADLEPAAAWPGHAEALTGDVAGQLRKAAETT